MLVGVLLRVLGDLPFYFDIFPIMLLKHLYGALVWENKNIKTSSFKSSENIQKKEDGSDSTVSNNQFSSVTLNELN